MTLRYIIEVSEKGFLPIGESKAMERLRKDFMHIRKLYDSEGIEGYIAERKGIFTYVKSYELEERFRKEKRRIRIYKLEEILRAG